MHLFEPDETRTLASWALGQLTMKDSSAAAAVRAVLRIATLRRHTWWQTWAYAQLSYMGTEAAIAEAKALLDEAFPDEEDTATHDAIVDSVFEDVRRTRLRLGDDLLFVASIENAERSLAIDEARMLSGETGAEVSASRDDLERVVTHVKNRAQTYLMSVECGVAPPMSGSEA